MKKLILLFTGIIISLNLSAQTPHFNITMDAMQFVSVEDWSIINSSLGTQYYNTVIKKIDFTSTKNTLKLKKVSGKLPDGVKLNAKLDAGPHSGDPLLSGKPTKAKSYSSSWKMTQKQNKKEIELCTIDLTINVADISTIPVISLIPKKGITVNGYVYDDDGETETIFGTVSYTVKPDGTATLAYETEYGKKTLRTKQWDYYYDDNSLSSYFYLSNKTTKIVAGINIYEKDGEFIFDYANIHDSNYGDLKIKFSDNSVNATDFEGYYTIGMVNTKDVDTNCNGEGYLTLTISSKGAARYSGMLPNGQTISGSTNPMAISNELLLPIVKKAGKNDVLNGVLSIKSNKQVYSIDGMLWKHTGKAAIDRYDVVFDSVFGTKYDKTATISTLFGKTKTPLLSFSNESLLCMFILVKDSKDKRLQLDSTVSKKAVTFKFNKSTGIFSGTIFGPITDDKPVKAKYSGVIISADSNSPYGYGYGSFYFDDKVNVEGKNITRVLGGNVVMPKMPL